MEKKIDEIKGMPIDVNSESSQIVLNELHKRSLIRQDRMKRTIEKWKREDQQDASKGD